MAGITGRLCAAILLLGAVAASLAPSAAAAQSSTSGKPMTDKVGLYITFWAAPGKEDELLAAVQAIMATSQQEKGTLVYAISTEKGARNGVSVFEIYENAEAQKIHGASPAIAKLRASLPGLTAGPPELHHITPVAGAKGLAF